MKESNLKDLEKILKAVANRRRLHILLFLKGREEATVGLIAEHIHLSFKSTSRHLAVLFSAGVTEKDQRGLEVYYSLSPVRHPTIKQILSIL